MVPSQSNKVKDNDNWWTNEDRMGVKVNVSKQFVYHTGSTELKSTF